MQGTMSSVNLPSYIQKAVDNIAIENGFRNYCVLNKPSSLSGCGGTMLNIAIKENDTNKEINIVCKTKPSAGLLQGYDIFIWINGFKREALFYDKIGPLFEQFQNEKNVSKEEQFSSYPKCYAVISDDEKSEYAILMEDLQPKGFKVWDKPQSTPLEHLRLSMRELGKFHGLSFALKDQKPEQFAEFKKLYDTIQDFALKGESGQRFVDGFHERAIKSLRIKEHKDIMRDINDNLVVYFENCVNNDTTDRFGVISHGDYHNYNILYKTNDNGTADEIRIIDWQTTRYVSPVIDILHTIFVSSEKSLRDRELNNLLTLYHNSLSKTIKLLGSNPEELFTLSDMYDEMKKCGNYALLSAPTVTQVYLTGAMNATEKSFDQMNSDMNDTDQVEYNQKINEVIADIVKFGCYQKINKV